ncbi:MAG: hypothetical protein ABL994_13375, partial [Verrucomicrobiales bacterium]
TMFIEVEEGRFVTHYNKQAMRDYFALLHDDWITAIKEAKALGQQAGVAFTEILKTGQEKGDYALTPEVDPEFLALQVRKMSAIREYITGVAGAEAVRGILAAAGREEIAFYRARGVIDGLRKINGISS